MDRSLRKYQAMDQIRSISRSSTIQRHLLVKSFNQIQNNIDYLKIYAREAPDEQIVHKFKIQLTSVKRIKNKIMFGNPVY